MPSIILFILLFFHECGHFLMALLFGFSVDKIYFYPWGGISKFTTKLNTSLFFEFIVLFMGPFFQVITYFILCNISFFNGYLDLIRNIHYSLLFFNLMPIYPLDGGKLVNIIFNLFFPFRRSLFFSIYFSYFFLILFFVININDIGFNLIFIFIFLFYKIFDERGKINFYMDKFLLERYLYNFNFKRVKKVRSVKGFFRGCRHIIYDGDRYFSEKEILLKKFKK